MSNIGLSFASQRTATGFNSNQLAYSLDGINFTDFGSAVNPATAFALISFDLSSITALNNQASVFLRYTFSGASSSGGNNRIDNLQVTGISTAVPAPANLMMVGIAGLCFTARRFKWRRVS
jgi:hypothetical protein